MKVILTKDVPSLGRQGDVVNAAEGYARNYLFPRNLAIEANKGNLKNIEKQRAVEERLKEQRIATAQSAAAKIEGASVTISHKAGSGTRLFGSITAQDVAEAIKEQLGVEVDKRKVGLEKPIKSLGEYDISVQLHRDVTSRVKIAVVASDQA